MFILQKKNSYIFLLFILILTSCRAFLPIEPVSDVNDKFNSNYGNIVKKSKKKHYNSIKKSGYDGTVSFEKTAYGRLKQNEIDFLEINARNNPYIEVERAGDKNLEYLSYNAGAYTETEDNIFDNIEIPKNDFKYYNLGRKEYNEINNIELQETYDYMDVINKERLKQIEIARLKEEALKKNREKDSGILDKTKKGLKNLTDRIKNLLN